MSQLPPSSGPPRVFFVPMKGFPLYYLPRSRKVVSLAIVPPTEDAPEDGSCRSTRGDKKAGDSADAR